MINTQYEKKLNRIMVLNALYIQLKADTSNYVDLKKVAMPLLGIDETECENIFKYLKHELLIDSAGQGIHCRLTQRGIKFIEDRNKVSDKEMILDFLEYMGDNVNQYSFDIVCERCGIASILRIDHMLDIMLNNGLVKPTNKPNNKYTLMPNHKGFMLTPEGYDNLFKSTDPPLISITNNKIENNAPSYGNQSAGNLDGNQEISQQTNAVATQEKNKSFAEKVWFNISENKLISFLVGSLIVFICKLIWHKYF